MPSILLPALGANAISAGPVEPGTGIQVRQDGLVRVGVGRHLVAKFFNVHITYFSYKIRTVLVR